MHGNPQWFISKDPPEMQETQQEPWFQSLGQEDPLDKEMATHSDYCLGNPTDSPWGHKRFRHNLETKQQQLGVLLSPTHTQTYVSRLISVRQVFRKAISVSIPCKRTCAYYLTPVTHDIVLFYGLLFVEGEELIVLKSRLHAFLNSLITNNWKPLHMLVRSSFHNSDINLLPILDITVIFSFQNRKL